MNAIGNDRSDKLWHKNNVLHREDDLPAAIRSDGTYEWWYNGLRHRNNGPAYIEPNGSRYFYENGLRHRNNDLPAVEEHDGTLIWYTNGKLHREYKPAIMNADYEYIWIENDIEIKRKTVRYDSYKLFLPENYQIYSIPLSQIPEQQIVETQNNIDSVNKYTTLREYDTQKTKVCI
jgi:hypothetical protein